MGYYTRFELEWQAIETPAKYDISDDLNKRIGDYIESHDEMNYCMNPNGSSEEPGKWYDHQKDMIEMSLRFPGVLFTLSGEGEEGGDLWKSYFFNGKNQHAKAEITYRPFDKGELR